MLGLSSGKERIFDSRVTGVTEPATETSRRTYSVDDTATVRLEVGVNLKLEWTCLLDME